MWVVRVAVAAAVLTGCTAVLADDAYPFWTRNETSAWLDYYSPFGKNSVYFQPKRETNPLKMYICSGMGRTGTTSVASMMKHFGVTPFHEHTPFTWLPTLSLRPGAVANMINATRWLERGPTANKVAGLDNPVGVFAWELMDAFPDYHVLHAVRPADAWEKSLAKLIHNFGWPPDAVNEATFHVGSHGARRRSAVRRFFELNSMIVSTVPEDRLSMIDITGPQPTVTFQHLFQEDVKRVPHQHNSHVHKVVAEMPAVHHVNATSVVAASSNRAGLNLAAVITPVPVGGLPNPSSLFFAPGRATSSWPLVVAAGLDGTGLDVLSRVFEAVGKAKVRFPAFNLEGDYVEGRPTADAVAGGKLEALLNDGLQTDKVTPAEFDGVDLVMGQPVPLLVWDFLEAFPNAKVILTVRQVDDWWNAMQKEAPQHGFVADSRVSKVFNLWMWGAGPHQPAELSQRRVVREYLVHNNKVIFGVPKKQLLVWDPHASPSWEPVCDFLGVPVPSVPFPTDDYLA